MIGDFHIHSKYSFDSIMSPKKIIKTAVKKNIDLIAITDHNTIKGGVEVKKASGDNIKVIVGAEIKTDIGDIIGFNLNNEIKSINWEEVLDQIKAQGGLSMLPHPYRSHRDLYSEIGNVKIFVDEKWNLKEITVKKRANEHQILESQILGYIRRGEIYKLICKGIEKLFEI